MDSDVFYDDEATDDAKSAARAQEAADNIDIDVEALKRESRFNRQLNEKERTEKLAEAWRMKEIAKKG